MAGEISAIVRCRCAWLFYIPVVLEFFHIISRDVCEMCLRFLIRRLVVISMKKED